MDRRPGTALRRLRTRGRWAAACGLLLALLSIGGCGQKGDLFLPEPSPEELPSR